MNQNNRRSLEDIGKTIEEIALIDNLLPRALPLYINKEWSSKQAADHYKTKLAEAGELQALIDKIKKDNEFGDTLRTYNDFFS